MTKKIGNIGLGPMGGHIARLLLEKNFDVIGFDINSERMLELERIGMELADSALDLANEADVIITSLPSFESLTSVIDELKISHKCNQIVIECSTLEVEQKIKGQVMHYILCCTGVQHINVTTVVEFHRLSGKIQ